ncbi:MAG TPA: hypothetical protein VJX67_00190 [Blastocatellia bacterium]|nr:hypothetical protein [Blastocatellia bacterium]
MRISNEPLADYFSDGEKLESFQRQFVAGLVLYLHCDFIKKAYQDKFLLLACVNPAPLYLVINSEPAAFIRANKALLDCQVCITKNDHSFLDHDSYVDCLKAYSIEQSEVERQVLSEMGKRLKGRLSSKAVQAVLDAVADSPTLIRRDQLWIANDLKP